MWLVFAKFQKLHSLPDHAIISILPFYRQICKGSCSVFSPELFPSHPMKPCNRQHVSPCRIDRIDVPQSTTILGRNLGIEFVRRRTARNQPIRIPIVDDRADDLQRSHVGRFLHLRRPSMRHLIHPQAAASEQRDGLLDEGILHVPKDAGQRRRASSRSAQRSRRCQWAHTRRRNSTLHWDVHSCDRQSR